MKKALTIAGSDPSGGAGIQADLKTMCAMGVYGMSVITAVTAQNTQRVHAFNEVLPDIVAAQIDAVFLDIPPQAVKIGMVSNSEIRNIIVERLTFYGAENIVVDPVMVSTSGHRLMDKAAVSSMNSLIEICDLITPNVPEAEILTGIKINSRDDMLRCARRIQEIGAKNVLIKGGHLKSQNSEDLLLLEEKAVWLSAKRIQTKNTHGTGCTLSSAIASCLARGESMESAVRISKNYVTRAIENSLDIGKGSGPLGHMSEIYKRAGITEDFGDEHT